MSGMGKLSVQPRKALCIAVYCWRQADLQLRHAGWRAASRRIEDSQLHEKCELEETWQASLEGMILVVYQEDPSL